MVTALANSSGCGDGARPAASLHSVAEEIGRPVLWWIGTDEHIVDGTDGGVRSGNGTV